MPLPVPGVNSEAPPGCHAGLQGQHAPGMGLGAPVRPPLPLLWPLARGSASGRPATLYSPLQPPPRPLSPSEVVWGVGRIGPKHSFVWSDRVTICFGSWVFLTPTNFSSSLDTGSLSYSCLGSDCQGQQKERNACHTHLGLDRKMGDGGDSRFFPSFFHTTFSFLLGLMSPFSWEAKTCSSL